MGPRTKMKSHSIPHEPVDRIDGPANRYWYRFRTGSCTGSMYQFSARKTGFFGTGTSVLFKEKINIYFSLNKTDVPVPKKAVFLAENWYIEPVQEPVPNRYRYRFNHVWLSNPGRSKLPLIHWAD